MLCYTLSNMSFENTLRLHFKVIYYAEKTQMPMTFTIFL